MRQGPAVSVVPVLMPQKPFLSSLLVFSQLGVIKIIYCLEQSWLCAFFITALCSWLLVILWNSACCRHCAHRTDRSWAEEKLNLFASPCALSKFVFFSFRWLLI